MENKLIEPENY